MIAGRTYYEILGVGRGATISEIRKAYRRLLVEWHPDKNHEEGAHQKCLQIIEAYQVLKDMQKRLEYDRLLDLLETPPEEDTEGKETEHKRWVPVDSDEDTEEWRSEEAVAAAEEIKRSLSKLLRDLDELAFYGAPRWVKWTVGPAAVLAAVGWIGRLIYIRYPDDYHRFVLFTVGLTMPFWFYGLYRFVNWLSDRCTDRFRR